MKYYLTFFIIIFAFSDLRGCSMLDSSVPAKLDHAPVIKTVDNKWTEGTARVRFVKIDTGGDQGHFPRSQYPITINVRFDDKEVSQTIASCKESAGTSHEISQDELDNASCDNDFYRAFFKKPNVLVTDQQGKEFFRFKIPEHITKVTGPSF